MKPYGHDFICSDGLCYKCNTCGFKMTMVAQMMGIVPPFCMGIEAKRVSNKTVNESLKKTCTCGSAKVGSPRHSDWCDI